MAKLAGSMTTVINDEFGSYEFLQRLYHNAPDIDLEEDMDSLNVARIAGHFKVGRERARRIRAEAEKSLDD